MAHLSDLYLAGEKVSALYTFLKLFTLLVRKVQMSGCEMAREAKMQM
jgi:hypothetical protein